MKSTKESEILFARSKAVVPGGVHSPVRSFRGVGGTPRFVTTALGAEIEDVDQNRYIDYCMSWGPLIFGHQDPEIREATHAALRRGWTYGTAEPYSLELAEFMTTHLPWIEKVRFVNSGTEAVMTALRIARAATGRHKILKFDGCYHGHVDSLLVRAGSGLADMASPDSAGVSPSVAADTIIIPLDSLADVEAAFKLHGPEIAAIIIEGIPANNGLLLQRETFLKEIARMAAAAGSLFILDEVITGFRTAFGGMVEITGVKPDLVTYGKIIGGGFPVGAVGGRADLMDWLAPVGPAYQAGTLSGNPVAMVAGLVSLQKLKRENPYALLEKRTKALAQSIEALAPHVDFPIQVQHFSSMFWVVLGKVKTDDGMVRRHTDTPSDHKGIYAQAFHELLEEGVYLAPSAFEISSLSTAHEDHHQERFVTALEKILRQMGRHTN